MGKPGSASKADTAVKLVLIFFISLLSFSVGTYVGKQVSDSDSRRAALEVDAEGEEFDQAATSEEVATAPLSEEDVSTLTEEFLAKERKVASEEVLTDAQAKVEAEPSAAGTTEEGYTHHATKKAKEMDSVVAQHTDAHGHATPAAHADAKADHHADAKAAHHAEAPKASTAAERVAEDKSPAADARKKREPTGVLPSVASTAIGKYTVQVASYATEEEAKAQASKLTTKGYSAFYVPAEVNSKTWYRVSVGLFSDQKSASNYRTELLATQAVTSAIVQKIVK